MPQNNIRCNNVLNNFFVDSYQNKEEHEREGKVIQIRNKVEKLYSKQAERRASTVLVCECSGNIRETNEKRRNETNECLY